ncbi:hypothetical protein Poly41_17730 [Novipirellula artificiosorum]|uniref:Uncharacterized protein n=2 Tax=Novipirellula artificiosorum TaxID=2528016 RepID=A0A5C6DW96_9BACT|nr:hypothetical protein Poly41_17730 [Novipirellula artificiosorum]
MRIIWITAVISFLILSLAPADEPLFSGPQVGEAFVPFEAPAAFGSDEDVEVLADVEDSPLLLVFVHQVTRPSIATVRLVMNYAATKKEQGLKSRLVFLGEDPTETEAFLRRARSALPQGVTPRISLEGIEGPGSYGLNRKMTLTVLVGTKGNVTANFPLVQPSLQTDAPKIGHAIVKVLGGQNAPTLAEMGFQERSVAMRAADRQPDREQTYRRMMSPVIQKNATPEEVAAAAKIVEDFAANNAWFKERVHQASSTIVGSGKLSNYGTTEAQALLRKWSKAFASSSVESTDRSQSTDASNDPPGDSKTKVESK